jgi:hypothetical protein
MAAKLTILTHKIAIQLYLVTENCTTCSSRTRRPVRKILVHPRIIPLQFCNPHDTIQLHGLHVKLQSETLSRFSLTSASQAGGRITVQTLSTCFALPSSGSTPVWGEVILGLVFSASFLLAVICLSVGDADLYIHISQFLGCAVGLSSPQETIIFWLIWGSTYDPVLGLKIKKTQFSE